MNDFLIDFHKKHFGNTNIPIYSKEVFYKLIEEIRRLDKESELDGIKE